MAPANLTSLPPETLVGILDALPQNLDTADTWKRFLSFASTCKHLHEVVNAEVYARNVKKDGSSALVLSVKKGNLAGIKIALRHGANPHAGDRVTRMDGKPLNLDGQMAPLHWAANNGNVEAVKILLDSGADVNHRVRLDTSVFSFNSLQLQTFALHYAKVVPPPCPIMRDIIYQTRGALVVVKDSILCNTLEYGANALYFALANNHHEVAKALIDAGASLVTHLGTGVTACHQADYNNNDELLEYIRPHIFDEIRSLTEDLPRADDHDEYVNAWFFQRWAGEEPGQDLLHMSASQWISFWRRRLRNEPNVPRLLCGGLVEEGEDEEKAQQEALEDDQQYELRLLQLHDAGYTPQHYGDSEADDEAETESVPDDDFWLEGNQSEEE